MFKRDNLKADLNYRLLKQVSIRTLILFLFLQLGNAYTSVNIDLTFSERYFASHGNSDDNKQFVSTHKKGNTNFPLVIELTEESQENEDDLEETLDLDGLSKINICAACILETGVHLSELDWVRNIKTSPLYLLYHSWRTDLI